jgi:hypothetical protein
MTHINRVIKKHFTHRYTDRGKVGRQGKVMWYSMLRRIRASKHQTKIRI